MGNGPHILVIDQGTTSTRAILFDDLGTPVASAAETLEQLYPKAGWVEHDPEAIWQAAVNVSRDVLAQKPGIEPVALGLTNQRETTVLWDRHTGEPVHKAIVWQDRRTAELCKTLREEGLSNHVNTVTGLLIDPYFSGTKLHWLFENDPTLRARARRGDLAFGTIDSWLIYKMTGGKVHATDATNASRTMLFDIKTGTWDDKLLNRLDIPRQSLPEVHDCQHDYGLTDSAAFGCKIPIRAVAGDQQAAAFGQACFSPAMVKATFGTGCFLLANTGEDIVRSRHQMLSTIFYQTAGQKVYALEGSIFMAGATLQWLRETLGLYSSSSQIEPLAREADPASGVYLVPAFQGLGAPYWDADARGAILGLSRAASKAEIVRAGLESVAFQTRDLLEAMSQDMRNAGISAPTRLRVDGGMTANSWLMQFLADCLKMPIDVAAVSETTALGAAYHAALSANIIQDKEALSRLWKAQKSYEPTMPSAEADDRYGGWQCAVERVRKSG